MTARDYSTISPSAKSLLLLKGLTTIPFARQAAELMMKPETYVPDYESKGLVTWGRVVHFENRYYSIDQLLEGLAVKNILELSSGFSFRGLTMAKDHPVHYIDTDLPGVIETKKEFTQDLQAGISMKGTLEILALNALDEDRFLEIVARFPPGEIVIVNEGLLMYLDEQEKEKLCRIIRKVLLARGGWWITADIYTKMQRTYDLPKMDDQLQRFLDAHKIEEKKFDSEEAAKQFFQREGFRVDKEAVTDYSKVTSLKYLLNAATPEQMEKMRSGGKISATWRLKAI